MRRRNNTGGQHHSNGGANRPHGGGHNRPRRYNNNSSRSFNAEPDGQNNHANASRIRRHAMTQREKYYNMARDALSSGDRVQAEYYFQHVEHYVRVMNELPPEEVRTPQRYNNPPSQHGEGQPQAENGNAQESSPQAQPENTSGEYREEVESPRPAASALPSFITGGRSRPAAGNAAPRQTDEE